MSTREHTAHFEKLFRDREECAFMDAYPGAGWGRGSWKTSLDRFESNPGKVFQVAVEKALAYMKKEYSTSIVAWVAVDCNEATRVVEFKVGCLY
jgi:hypothetical protein